MTRPTSVGPAAFWADQARATKYTLSPTRETVYAVSQRSTFPSRWAGVVAHSGRAVFAVVMAVSGKSG
jgi:hypothetical protein